MHDDVSAIPESGCSVLSSPDTISNYNGRIRKDYIQNGGKWYFYRTQTSTYSDYDISNYNCINVQSLSSYAVFQPFIYGLAFILFGVVIVAFFKIIRGIINV